MTTTLYPAGGWLPPGAPVDWQRADQGRDFVTAWRGVIQAPGAGECVGNGSDRPFPGGFGPRFPLLRIDTGRFAGHTWYVGHTTSLLRPGERFGFGHPVSHADQGHPSQIGISVRGDGGWVELGTQLPNGQLGPLAPNGHWFDHLLMTTLVVNTPDPPLCFGDRGWRVLGLTSNLRAAGYLTRPYWVFNRQVHHAVIRFKEDHRLPMPPLEPGGRDRGVVDARTDQAIKQAAAARHRKRRS